MPASDDPLSPFTRERIARLAEDALRRAEVLDVFPTPIEAVQRAAGVRERIDIAELPDEVRAKKPSVFKRVLGALWFEQRTVFIDTEQAHQRVLFTDAHEATHAMCGWHEDVLRLDTEDELFHQLHPGVEAEANFGAGHLIFQGGRFHRLALLDQVSLRTPLALAARYGASRHAAAHYYVQEHPDAVALLVAGRYPYFDKTLPVWRSVESPEFLRRFGRLRDRLPAGQLSLQQDALFAGILEDARLAVDPPSTPIVIPDNGSTKRRFVAEAFFNGYTNLIFVAETKSRRLGQRVRLAS
ncbi:MAG: ImmA/IrrE family metallo-endopeptidase [Solirubrobacteraceae bacterium]